jgi:hypothetical protein
LPLKPPVVSEIFCSESTRAVVVELPELSLLTEHWATASNRQMSGIHKRR